MVQETKKETKKIKKITTELLAMMTLLLCDVPLLYGQPEQMLS